jgi:hypothetical protein
MNNSNNNHTNSLPSLCIPRVHTNITESRIRNVFTELKLGVIHRIDIVNRKEEKFKIVFIHFKKWFQEGNAVIARERLMNGQEIKVIYDDPWFWKISAYKERELKKESNKQYKKPILQLTDEFGRDIHLHNEEPVKQFFKHEPRTPSTSPPRSISPPRSTSPPRLRELQEDKFLLENIYTNTHTSEPVDYSEMTIDYGEIKLNTKK